MTLTQRWLRDGSHLSHNRFGGRQPGIQTAYDLPSYGRTRLEKRSEALEGLKIALAEPLALFEEPLVVASLEKISRVQLDGFLQGGEAAVGGFPLRPRE